VRDTQYEKSIEADNMDAASSRLTQLSPAKAMLMPGAFIAGLAALGLALRSQEVVSQSILGAAAVLLVWAIILLVTAQRSNRTLLREVKLFKHHWVQVCTQVVIYSGSSPRSASTGLWCWPNSCSRTHSTFC